VIPHAPILAILLPLFAAFLMPVVGILAKRCNIKYAREIFAIAVIVAVCVMVVSMAPAVWGGEILVYRLGGWAPPWGINLVVDGLSLLMAITIAGIGSLVVIYSIEYMRHKNGQTQYYTLLLLITAGMMGVVLTGDIFNLYVFLEITCISAYALVAFERRGESVAAGIKYLIISSIGTSLLMFGIALTYGVAGSLNIADLAGRLAIINSGGQSLSIVMVLILTLFVVGFCIKSAVVPMHAWLVDAYPAAPSPISALLSGVVVAIGVYCMLRIEYMMFGAMAIGVLLSALGLVSMIVGGLMALVQRDLKRLLAYSTVSTMGYIVLGVGLGTAMGIQGGLFHLFNNAVMNALLFMCAGAIVYRAGTRNLDELGGLYRNMPVTATVFTIGALAVAGVPPLNGFASKWAIYIAGIEAGSPIFTIIAIIISVLTLAYFLKVIASVFLGSRPTRLRDVKEAPKLMLVPMCLLAALCIVFGVLPQLGIDLVQPAQEAIMQVDNYIESVLGGV
jgi:multicomponent Na+:H+ antiporter subunit D